LVRRGFAEYLDLLAQPRPRGESLPVQGQPPGLGQAELLQIAHQPAEPQHVVIQGPQGGGVRLSHAVLQQFQLAPQDRQGRTQFVRHVG